MENTTIKPWGNENLLFQGAGYAVKRITLNEGKQTSLHYHEIKHETVMVFSGTLHVYIDDKSNPPGILALGAGEALAISPNVIHRMSATTGQVVYFEAQTDHLNDVVRLNDDYGRL